MNFRLGDPDHDVGQLAFGPIFQFSVWRNGTFAAAVGAGEEAFILAVGRALDRDGAGDVGAEGMVRSKEKKEEG